jgi:hypothetical protein
MLLLLLLLMMMKINLMLLLLSKINLILAHSFFAVLPRSLRCSVNTLALQPKLLAQRPTPMSLKESANALSALVSASVGMPLALVSVQHRVCEPVAIRVIPRSL